MRVHCPGCHREERWDGAARALISPGGSRRPSEHPELAAWRVLRASRSGATGPVVGPCPACGLPLVAEGAVSAAPWRLALPNGHVVVDRGLRGPGGPLDEAGVTRLLEDAYAEGPLSGFRPGLALFQASLLSVMVVPVALWVLGVLTIGMFLTHFYR